MNKYRKTYLVCKSLEGLSLSVSATTYVFFVLSHGYPIWVVLVANMVFMGTYTLLDPFTGRLGDVFGQRRTYVAGAVFWGVGMFTYGVSGTIPGFFLAEFLAAIGRALSSEALESWLENEVGHKSVEIRASGDKWQRLWGIPAGVAGGLIGSAFGFQWPWLIEGGLAWIHAMVAWRMLSRFPKEAHHAHEEETVPSVWESLKETRSSKALQYSVLFVIVTAFCFQPLNMYWTEVLRQASGGATWWQGVVWVFVALALSYGSELTRSITNVTKGTVSVLLLSAAVAILIAAVAASRSILVLTVLFFVAHEVPRGMIKNVMFTFANKHIRGVNRSTMNSIRSAALPAGSFLGLGFFALFSALVPQPEMAWAVSGIVLLIFAGYTQLQKWGD